MNEGLEANLDQILPILESREAALSDVLFKPLEEITRDCLAGVEILDQSRPPPDDGPPDNGPQAAPMPVTTAGVKRRLKSKTGVRSNA